MPTPLQTAAMIRTKDQIEAVLPLLSDLINDIFGENFVSPDGKTYEEFCASNNIPHEKLMQQLEELATRQYETTLIAFTLTGEGPQVGIIALLAAARLALQEMLEGADKVLLKGMGV